MTRQIGDDDFACCTQYRDLGAQGFAIVERREYGTSMRHYRGHSRKLFQVERKTGRRPGAPKGFADFVITSAARKRIGQALDIGRKHYAAVVLVATQLGKIDAHLRPAHLRHQSTQLCQCRCDARIGRQFTRGLLQHLGPAIQARQQQKRLAQRCGQAGQCTAQRWNVLGLNARKQLFGATLVQRGHRRQRAEHADVADVEAHRRQTGQPKHMQQQILDFDIRFNARMAVDFSTDLQGLTRGVHALRQGMQHRPAIGQARDSFAIEQVRINARGLRRGIGAQAHAAARQLIDQLERAQIHVMAGAGHQ